VTASYDSRGRVSTISSAAPLVKYEYDSLDRLVAIASANGARKDVSRDALGRVSRQRTTCCQPNGSSPGQTVVSDVQLSYDNVDRVALRVDEVGTTTYSYDGAGRLTKAVTVGASPRAIAYTYDAAGNRLTLSDTISGNVSSTLHAAGRPTTVGGGVHLGHYAALPAEVRRLKRAIVFASACVGRTELAGAAMQFARPSQDERKSKAFKASTATTAVPAMVVQRRLAVGAIDDALEIDADRQATQVMRRLSASEAFPSSESSRIRPMSSGAHRVSADHVGQPTGTSRIRAMQPGANRPSSDHVGRPTKIRRAVDTLVPTTPRPATGQEGLQSLKPPKKAEAAAHHQKNDGLKGAAHTDHDLQVLFAEASAVEQELKDRTKALAGATKGEPSFPPGLKDIETARAKVKNDYGGDASQVCDLLRSTVVYDTFDDLMHGLSKCLVEGFVDVVRDKDRYKDATGAGYRDICLNIKMSNGHVAELQLNLKAMVAAKQVAHKQYEELRRLEALVKKIEGAIPKPYLSTIARLQAESKALYGPATPDANVQANARAKHPIPERPKQS